MVLRTNDFGCVPDGRALERVTTTVGSATVQVDDGTLRSSDAAKLISIPGAIDLITEISALADRKDATKATIAEGETTLTAVFDDEPGDKFEAPFEGGDVGKRIVVTGAGSSGRPLLAFVATRIDRNTLELDLPAQTGVDGVLAVLNAPNRVILADHARATPVSDSTINLGDRTITDGQMIWGQTALRSATAQFSVEDLQKPVTILGAGRLVTGIAEVLSHSAARLDSEVQYAVSNGLADVWTPKPDDEEDTDMSDSRPAFREMLASLQLGTSDVESAEIEFGAGVYDFTNVAGGSIELQGVRNLTIRGAGAGATVLRLRPDQDLTHDAHVIRLTNCKNVTLRDFTVYGAYLTMGKVNEQMHGVFISEGCEEIVVERVRVFQTAGDGIRLLGEPGNNVRKVWIDKCRVIQNKRSGVAFQRNSEFVSVHNCYIEMSPPSNDSCIDLEPSGSIDTGHTAPTDITIDSNVFDHDTLAVAVSLSGINEIEPAQRVRFTNNVLRGGAIGGVNARDVTVANNTVRVGTRGPAMRFRGNYDGLRVEGNRISADAESALGGIRVVARDVSPSDIRIARNDINVPGVGIWLEDIGSRIEIRDNCVRGQGADVGIRIVVTNSPDPTHRDVTISGNTVSNFADAGIDLNRGSNPDTIEGLEISGNHIYVDAPPSPNDLVGIRLRSDNAAPWLEHALVAGNRIGADVTTPIFRGKGVPYIVTSGNPTSPAFLQGDGTPTSIPGPVGSLFLRLDTDPAEFYLKIDPTTWAQILTAPPDQ